MFNRFVLGYSLSWSEEFQKFGHVWMVMLAILVAYRRGAHLGMDMLLHLLPAGVQRGEAIAYALPTAGRHTATASRIAIIAAERGKLRR